jgi:replicative DNA helicase
VAQASAAQTGSVASHNLEAEESVLGGILSAASRGCGAGHRLLDRVVATGLLPQDFYLASHSDLFAALVRLREEGIPLDPVSVADALDRFGAEAQTRGRLVRLAYAVSAFSNVEHHAGIVARHARTRREA